MKKELEQMQNRINQKLKELQWTKKNTTLTSTE
jgi:hypothetical protein